MFIKVDVNSPFDADLSSLEYRVLHALATYADIKTGANCFPNQAVLAEKLGLKRRQTVNEIIGSLEKKGYIEREAMGRKRTYKLIKGVVFGGVNVSVKQDTMVKNTQEFVGDMSATADKYMSATADTSLYIDNQEPIYQEAPTQNIINHPVLARVDDDVLPKENLAVELIKVFDETIVDLWGSEQKRPWPSPKDYITCQEWLKKYNDYKFIASKIREFLYHIHNRKYKRPFSLNYLESQIQEAIKQQLNSKNEAKNDNLQTMHSTDFRRLRLAEYRKKKQMREDAMAGDGEDVTVVLSAIQGRQ